LSDVTFSPLAIGGLEVPNRIVMAPVKTALGGTDGLVSRRHVEHYRRRAAGGTGLVIVEPLYVDGRGREHPRQLGAVSDAAIVGLREVVDAVHEHGSKVFAHLNHAGRAANPKAVGGPPEGPSAVGCPSTGATSVPMTRERIREVVGAYADAARRAADSGFDGVELQLGLGYLPAQFLSPRTNKREDEYGARGEDRFRFAREVVEAVRRGLDREVPLTARIAAEEKVEGGLGLGEALELARRLEAWGVDALHVVVGSACDSPAWYYQHMALPEGVSERLASRVRAAVSIPLMVAGRLGDPGRIRALLETGAVDAVALGRPLLADPDLPAKMAAGREDEIMACGSCLQGCLAQVKVGGPIGCIVNPEVGQDPIRPATAFGEHLVVVGGGPAGMEAALVGRRAGYRVTLLERLSRLGGQFALAPATPGKEAMEKPLRSLIQAVCSAGIDIRTGEEATVPLIQALEPDRVIVATGSRPAVPPVDGLEDSLTAADVLEGRRAPGRRVLILGGGLVGIEMAELLANRGHEIVVVELLEEIARDMETVTRKMTLRRLGERPVVVYTSTRLTRLKDGEAFAVSADSAEEVSLGRFDSVLVSIGHRSYDPLSAALEEAGMAVTVVGDAVRPGQILDATRMGARALERVPAGEDARQDIGTPSYRESIDR
jgi:2,4-dienoyl-CoA reductase-like NADH-dependent reductase (Old Yellow Enzyme family)/thioredoxin reductase